MKSRSICPDRSNYPEERLTRSLSTFIRSAQKCPKCGGQTLSQWLDGARIGTVCQHCAWTDQSRVHPRLRADGLPVDEDLVDLAHRLRARCNGMTGPEREAAFKAGMRIIEGLDIQDGANGDVPAQLNEGKRHGLGHRSFPG
jgi:hypothetical protein